MTISLLDEYLERPETKRALLSLSRDEVLGLARPAITALPELVPFDIQNVTNYLKVHFGQRGNNGNDLVQQVPRFVPPFDSMWFESRIGDVLCGVQTFTIDLWKEVGEGAAYETARLLLRQALSDAPHEEYQSNEYDVPRDVRWVVRAWRYARRNGRFSGPNDYLTMFLRADGLLVFHPETLRPSTVTLPIVGDWSYMTPSERYSYRHTIRQPYIDALMAIGFTHCKNVAQVDAPCPDEFVTNARAKKLKRPETRFRVLMIDPVRQAARHDGDFGHGDPGRSLHICRGHFVTYSEDKPLFGRLAGTFWKPAHVRGSITHGAVAKQYAVRPGELAVSA